MRKITQFSVNYPVTVSMIVIAILLLGWISVGRLSIDLFPEMNAPRIFVEIKAGERPPEEIEKQFVENIESQAIRQKGVTQVASVCMVGTARITVEYAWGRDMDEAFLDLQKALTTYSQDAEIDEFTITQHDPNASPVMIYGMLHPEISDMDELRQTGENYIRNELIRLEGIADVQLSGTEEKEVRILTDPYRLEAFGLTADNIVTEIQNMNRNVSGGTIVEMGKEYIIKGAGLLQNLNDIRNLVVAYRQSNTSPSADKVPVFLKDVAEVKFTNKDPQNIVRINGQRCVGLSIYKETGFNTVKAVEDLTEAMNNIQKALPGYEFYIVQNQGEFIQNAIGEVEETALMGVIIAVFVLFIFLRRLKVTLIISFAIPVSIIATFNLMYFNGLSLNIMTLGGLALGAGMLVDNAIVVMENIFRNLEEGMSVKEAAIEGTAEVGGAIVASTLTTIVVFLPIVYLHGASGALFKDQAWTVAFSLLASLFVAILVIPMLFHVAFKNRKSKPKKQTQSVRIHWYGRMLNGILSRRYLVILIALGVVGVTAYILPKVGSEYLPRSGAGEFTIDVKLPEGTQLERTEGAVKNMEEIINQAFPDELEIVYSQIGPTSASSTKKSIFQNENTASIKIHLSDSSLHHFDQIVGRISDLMGQIPDAEISIVRDETALQSMMGTDEAPLIVEAKGDQIEVLESLTEDVKSKLLEIPELLNVSTSIEEGAPELDVVIDRYKAGVYDLSVQNIASQLQDKLVGRDAGKYEYSGEMNDITIKMSEISLMEFHSITLNSGGTKVPLYEIANIEHSVSPKELHRRNQNRIGKVSADLNESISFDKVIDKVQLKLKEIDVPGGYDLQIIGEEQKRQEAMANLSFALMLSIILVYMVMASQFESLIHPFTILLTIPLAAIGAVWAFYILGKSFNMMAYIGIIMLAGIAVNDSIILVDAINKLKSGGLALRDAVIRAGENRIRPIFMTSITTILALFPLTLGIGESAALRSPMAIAVIAGLITSTLLTLVVIPCVYYVFESARLKIFNKNNE